jgi:pimeloyl-ACP methyl ester carboxylesterase
MRVYTGFSDSDIAQHSVSDALVIHRREGTSSSSTLVVFVHGLGGNRYGSWGNFPRFLLSDFQDSDIGLYAYRSGLSGFRISHTINLEAEASVFADTLRDCSNYLHLVLIGHSMGGLLCKAAIKVLIDRDDQATLHRIKAMFLLATPQSGSNWVPPFLAWITKETRALSPHADLLERLHRTFLDRVTSEANRPEKVFVPVFAVTAAEDAWVPVLSSGLHIDSSRRKVVRGTHTRIAKPEAQDDDVYQWVLARLRSVSTAAPNAPEAKMPDDESIRRSADLSMQYRQAYAAGKIVEALNCIAEAHQLTPNDSGVTSRYATALMRVGREKAVIELIDAAKHNGLYEDPIKGVEAEHLRRQGKPEQALRVLETTRNPDYYNIAYEKGMCSLLLYSQRKRVSDLLQALAHLRDARRSHPQHWWVTTNLAIGARVIGQPDEDVERTAIAQLQEAIQRHPVKASARIYRLLYYVMIQDMEHLTATVESDHASCPKTMEVACDFFDTVQERIALICPQNSHAKQFIAILERWPLPFTLLHA